MNAEQTIRAILAAREDWVDLPLPNRPGRRAKVRRPSAADLIKGNVGDGVSQACTRVVDWEGVVEDDLLGGNGVGSNDEVQFSAVVWEAWVVDQPEVIMAVVTKLGELVDKYRASTEANRKKLIARLDAQHRKEPFEGEQGADERLAVLVWNYLSNGSGGVDWSGLSAVVAHLGINEQTLCAVLDLVYTLKTHKTPDEEEEAAMDKQGEAG